MSAVVGGAASPARGRGRQPALRARARNPSSLRPTNLLAPEPVSADVRRASLFALAVAAMLGVSASQGRAADGCTPRAGDLRFRAADGTRLAGHRFGSGSTAVRPRPPER